MTDDEKILRELLWIRHGCPFSALYGDDGELQCGNCFIDFKRMPAKEIQDAFEQLGMASAAKVKWNTYG